MASATEKLLQYKFDCAFYEDGEIVVHNPFGSSIPVFDIWRTDEKLGAGAFGVVWRQKEITSGQLRAVKTISKLQLNARELEAMVELQDVGFYPTFIGHRRQTTTRLPVLQRASFANN